jgi:uncharacterized RDD family membrane protein YckC
MKNTQKAGLLAGIFLCSLCCILPIIGTAGLGSLAIVTAYFKNAVIGIIGVTILLFLYAFFRKRQTTKSCETSCATNCDCK